MVNSKERKMHIFLTGATGFLGTVLLRDLLLKGHTVTVLARPKHGVSPLARIKERLSDSDANFPFDKMIGHTLYIAEQGSGKEYFGLDKKDYFKYAGMVDMIIHNAACTQLEADWSIYEDVNIRGARSAIDFAALTRNKLLAYTSSAYVAGTQSGRVYEDKLIVEGTFRNRYEKSKAISENEVRQAAAGGLIKSMIFRPSIIIGSSSNGWMCQEHHFFDFIFRLSLIHKIILKQLNSFKLKVDYQFRIPGDEQATKNFVPVDYVANSIALLIEKNQAWGKTFHLTHPKPLKLKVLESYVQKALGWLEITLCSKREIQDLSPLEKKFFNSTKIYEKYFWEEPLFDQSNLKSVLGNDLPVPEPISQELVSQIVEFIKAKHIRRKALKMSRSRQPVAIQPTEDLSY
ncbi:MAG TPA: SDR family oxidoreductase [Candidatus Omnitrophota bacterium]|nr:SDR family oxidoreductase [Candidatus Omnitrophota bacterium]HPT39938.1 SDR family oxidoreductase [Candidatus Omnitrophota bacterium]